MGQTAQKDLIRAHLEAFEDLYVTYETRHISFRQPYDWAGCECYQTTTITSSDTSTAFCDLANATQSDPSAARHVNTSTHCSCLLPTKLSAMPLKMSNHGSASREASTTTRRALQEVSELLWHLRWLKSCWRRHLHVTRRIAISKAVVHRTAERLPPGRCTHDICVHS